MAVLGCIADDFTGASDAASFLVKGGLSVKLYNGTPTDSVTSDPNESHAIVIALKSRTAETNIAISESLKAAKYLLSQGVRQIYFKYCSTFDSTPKGNIGPVADALMDLTHSSYSILCPALPVNGRTVENGRLMVNGVPLDQSPMKNHPLTPMWDSSIEQLMKPQSKYTSYPINLSLNQAAISPASAAPYYLIPECKTEEDCAQIAKTFFHLKLLTGGSGILQPLAELWARKVPADNQIPQSSTPGRAVLLAGSCSKATLNQIAYYQSQGLPTIKIDPVLLLDGKQTVDTIWSYISVHTTDNTFVLAYSSDTPEKVREYQLHGAEKIAALLESTTAALAKRAVEAGYTRIISAGGETSGAVTKALKFSSYYIGQSVAPGVPIMVPVERPDIRLILKSGNFGQTDFFVRAIKMTQNI